MTQIETARVKELIGIQIGVIQQTARNLNLNRELQEIETGLVALEKTIAHLRETLAAISHTA